MDQLLLFFSVSTQHLLLVGKPAYGPESIETRDVCSGCEKRRAKTSAQPEAKEKLKGGN